MFLKSLYSFQNHRIVQAYDRGDVDFWGRQRQQVNPQLNNKKNMSFESMKAQNIREEKSNYMKASKDLPELIGVIKKSLNTYQTMAQYIRDFNASKELMRFEKISNHINNKGIKMMGEHEELSTEFKLNLKEIAIASTNIQNSIAKMDIATDKKDLSTADTLTDYTLLLKMRVKFTQLSKNLISLNQKAINFYNKIKSEY